MVGKPRRNLVTDEEIITSYEKTVSVFKTSRALGIGSTTVHRVLTKHSIPRPGLEVYRQNATKYRGQESAILEAYERGLTYNELRKEFGIEDTNSDYALKRAIKRAGGQLRENPAPLMKNGELNKIREMNSAGMSQVHISLALNRSQSFISRVMRDNAVETLSTRYKGENHPNWKGGRYKDTSRYIRVWISNDDPLFSMAFNDGSILEHRLILARKLGRPLLRTETVHHIDGNRENNDPNNLQIRQGRHGKNVVMICMDCGSHNVSHTRIADESQC